MNNSKTKKYIFTALLAALTTVATMAIQIPSPLSGYIHLGDSIVLLAGVLLGPLYGALAAGLGSMLADLLTGYFIFAPATLIIKGLAAFIAGYVYHKLTIKKTLSGISYMHFLIAGICGSFFVITGYFIYEIFLYDVGASALNILFNLIQTVFGIGGASLLYPLLPKKLLSA